MPPDLPCAGATQLCLLAWCERGVERDRDLFSDLSLDSQHVAEGAVILFRPRVAHRSGLSTRRAVTRIWSPTRRTLPSNRAATPKAAPISPGSVVRRA